MSVIAEKVARLTAAFDEVADCAIGTLTRDELLPVLDELEALGRRLPSQFQRMLARLHTETTPKGLGAKTWNEVLRTRWRLSTGEAGRRLAEVRELEPRPTVSGPVLAPVLPAVAAAQAAGAITPEMVTVLRNTMRDVPKWVDPITRSQVEVELVRTAIVSDHKALQDAAALRLVLLDQDGPEPDLQERDRTRNVSKGKQGRDGMTPLQAMLTPEAAALFEVLFAKFAAPGMCNPADPDMCTTGTPTQAQIDADDRTLVQRQHDALVVLARIALSTDLGQLNGLPVSVIIRTTLQDLESRGIAITGGGTRITMGDLDRLGGHAAYHLCVFDGATGSALNHFRSKRVATPAQRIMLYAKYGGCTKPGCPIGPYGCQIHHAVDDWNDGGNTNVDDMAPACGGDNRLVGPGGWTTRITDTGECEWIPPEHLDTGQTRINILHRPDLLLTPTDNDDAPWPWENTTPTPVGDASPSMPTVDDTTAPAPAPAPAADEAPATAPQMDHTTAPAVQDPTAPDTTPPPPAPTGDSDEPPFPPGEPVTAPPPSPTRDDDTPPFGTPDDAPPRARVWTDEDYAAFDRRYPNGPFADHLDDTPGTDDDTPVQAPVDLTDPAAADTFIAWAFGDDDTQTADTTGDAPPTRFTRFNATGLLSTSQTTRTRTRHELRQLLTHCTRKPPADNDPDDHAA